MLAFEPGKCEEAVAYIRDQFVCVAVDSYIPANSVEEVEWFFGSTKGNNSFWMAAPSGYKLGQGNSLSAVFGLNYCLGTLKGAVQEFSKLPDAERKPKLGKQGTPVEERKRIPTPPPGGLIAAYFIRFLERDARGELAPGKVWYAVGADGKAHTLDPHTREMVWFTESEWKSLVPQTATVGARVAVPEPVKNRIFGWHADLAWPDGGDEGPLRGGELTLTVDKVSEAGITLRLDGYIQKGDFAKDQEYFSKYKGDANDQVTARGHGGIDLRYLGYLNFSPKKKAFDRFDIVAAGDCWGLHSRIHRGNCVFGRFPIGFAWELDKGDRPMDRIPPKHAPAYAGGGDYLKQ